MTIQDDVNNLQAIASWLQDLNSVSGTIQDDATALFQAATPLTPALQANYSNIGRVNDVMYNTKPVNGFTPNPANAAFALTVAAADAGQVVAQMTAMQNQLVAAQQQLASAQQQIQDLQNQLAVKSGGGGLVHEPPPNLPPKPAPAPQKAPQISTSALAVGVIAVGALGYGFWYVYNQAKVQAKKSTASRASASEAREESPAPRKLGPKRRA